MHPNFDFAIIGCEFHWLRNALRTPKKWLNFGTLFLNCEQADNVRNQREHLVLLLANGMMQLYPAPIQDTV